MANPSPLRYPGGKHKTYHFIKSIIDTNNCTTYIEPFAGGAAVAINLLLENVVKKIIINDYDRSIYAFWHSVLYQPTELIHLIRETPITMNIWFQQKEIQLNKTDAPLLELGFSTLFLNRTNRSGILKGGVIGGKKQDGEYKMDCRFPKEKIIKKIIEISNLRHKIEIYNLDASLFIESVIKKTRNSFTFFDPPYYNKGPSLYTNFYTETDHLELAQLINISLKNRKWIVTYDSCLEVKKLYDKLNFLEFYLNYSAQEKTKGIEYMFFSSKTIIPEKKDTYLKLVS